VGSRGQSEGKVPSKKDDRVGIDKTVSVKNWLYRGPLKSKGKGESEETVETFVFHRLDAEE